MIVSAYPMPHRSAHPLRCAPYSKAIGMNVNLSKYGAVEKMMPVLRGVRITWKIECDTCYKLHTGVVFYVHIET